MIFFPEPFTNKVLVKSDVSNYATRSDTKNAMDVDILKFAKKYDLISLKTEVDSLNIDELEINLVDVIKKQIMKLIKSY